SLLWLGFTDDYREFRKDTIGSVFEKEIDTKLKLNKIGEEVLKQLNDNKESKSRSKAVRKYYLDMEKIVLNSYRLLNDGGMALFVIGNTEYKNVRIKNAEHLALAMIENGFSNVEVTKRKISNKILTPYRNSQGKFSKEKTGKKIYSEEFIVVGRK
ncbi:TPA: methyltransferase, partial [Enterococcus faecalis]|nr:methyltransferase [Enterococcus faecalis]